ncbi:uncharacterized protein [Diadema setosum]|uniref:uncharacterized protein isoform X2 n=1 Tax=Diadema setosum TaxID=31175 RepID=UPI003B3ACB9E
MSEATQEKGRVGEDADVVNVLSDIMAPMDDDFAEEVKTTTPAKKVVPKKVTKPTKSPGQAKVVKKPTTPNAQAPAPKPTAAAKEDVTPTAQATNGQKASTPTPASSAAATPTSTKPQPASATATPTTKKKVVKKVPVKPKAAGSSGSTAAKQTTTKQVAGKAATSGSPASAKKTVVAAKTGKKAAPAKDSSSDAARATTGTDSAQSLDQSQAKPENSPKTPKVTVAEKKEEAKVKKEEETEMEVTEEAPGKEAHNSAEMTTGAGQEAEEGKETSTAERDVDNDEDDDEDDEDDNEEEMSNAADGDESGDVEPPDFNDSFDVRSEASSSSSESQVGDNESDNEGQQKKREDRKRQFSPIVYEGKHDSDSEDSSKRSKMSSSIREVIPADQTAKMKYLFRDARYFLIKSNNHENIALAKAKGVWSTLPYNEQRLNQAFRESRNILLIFSVKESGKFQGFARMRGESRRDGQSVNWVLPSGMNRSILGGVFKVDWITRHELPFTKTTHLYNSWNDNKPVKIGRDGQEIEPKCGESLCRLFPRDENIDVVEILRAARRRREESGHRLVPRSTPKPRFDLQHVTTPLIGPDQRMLIASRPSLGPVLCPLAGISPLGLRENTPMNFLPKKMPLARCSACRAEWQGLIGLCKKGLLWDPT